MKVHAYRLDRFYRYVWEARGEYTTEVTPEDAERYINLLAETDDNRSHKSKCVQSVLILYKWRRYELDEEEVDIDNPFSSGGEDGIKDYLSKTEMRKIRNSAYEYGRIPTEDKTEEEIDELRTHLSQRFGKSKDGLSIEDCRSWKVPSLVEVSLEAGLRPCEVERASVDWVNEENMKLRIPKEDSAKNRNYWDVALTEETTNTLQKWLKERDSREMYEDIDLIWLTRKGNPYQSQSLRRLIHRLFETADISKEGRQTSWYILRHSAGTHIYEEGGLNHVSEQLRHLGFDTSLRYVHSPISERRSSIKPMLTDDRKPSRTPSINPLLLKQSSIG
jgi:site-specific recombinase XerD